MPIFGFHTRCFFISRPHAAPVQSVQLNGECFHILKYTSLKLIENISPQDDYILCKRNLQKMRVITVVCLPLSVWHSLFIFVWHSAAAVQPETLLSTVFNLLPAYLSWLFLFHLVLFRWAITRERLRSLVQRKYDRTCASVTDFKNSACLITGVFVWIL